MMGIWMGVFVTLMMGLYPIIYNVFFHPLRHFPGPRMAGATTWWKAYKEVFQQETVAQLLFDLHRKHGEIEKAMLMVYPDHYAGEVVRIGPNELHFGKHSAFHDIYHGTNRWDKDEGLYRTPGVRSGSFVFLKYEDARERREVLQPMFSKRAIQNIEGLVWRNANHLASAITRANTEKSSVDFLYAFRSFTLDTVMCFAFGKCGDALDAPAFADPLIVAMDASLRALPLLRNFPLIRKIAYFIPPSLIMKAIPDAERVAPRIYRVWAIVREQLQVVLRNPEKLDEAPHQTIFHRMLDAKAHRTQTVPDFTKLHDEGLQLIFAGTNTVADTLLMGHWNILNQPELLAQLKAELLTLWPDLRTPPSHKDLETLPLLTATIKESLRHLPSGVSLARVVPPTGAVISGRNIPGGTTVGMAILHVHQSEEIFEDAPSFKPDRWLREGAKDLEQWLVPFSRGPRMCVGVNLAWCELYIAFATMLRRFDMALDGTTAKDMEWRECIAPYYPHRHLHAWCRPAES